VEVLHSYWFMPLVSRLTLAEQARLLVRVFALVFASVAVLHLFLPGAAGPGALLQHALQIAVGYVLWFAALGAVLAPALERGWMGPVRVWHVWLLSAACYLLGYFAVSFDDALTVALHPDVHEAQPLFHFLRLLPVWLLVTWVFTEGYVGRSRRAALERVEVESVSRPNPPAAV